jgi:uncharacterized protein Veg
MVKSRKTEDRGLKQKKVRSTKLEVVYSLLFVVKSYDNGKHQALNRKR